MANKIVSSNTSLSSDDSGLAFNSSVKAQPDSVPYNHWGAFHHISCLPSSEGYRPLEAQSMGLGVPGTWYHWFGGTSSVISAVWFAIKGLNWWGLPCSTLRTIMLSVQVNMLLRGILNTTLRWNNSLVTMIEPHRQHFGFSHYQWYVRCCWNQWLVFTQHWHRWLWTHAAGW